MVLILTNPQITTLLHTLTPREFSTLSTTLATALIALSTTPASIQQPLRTSLTTPNDGRTTLFMPSAYDGTTAIKTVCLSPTHPPCGSLTLMSASGELEGVLNAEEITGFRTALASLLLLKARQRIPALVARSVVVFGTGKQAEWAVRLLQREIAGVAVTVVGRGTCEQVRRKMPRELSGFEVVGRAEDGAEDEIRRLLGDVDAVFCCTPSTAPLFPTQWLRATERPVYLSLIGSYKPHMLEVDPGLLRLQGVTVVVDSADACLKEAGELIQGGFKASEVVEIGKVLDTGDVIGGVCVFKCVGLGVMDLAAGRGILKIAQGRGVGVKVEGFDE